MKTKMYNEEKAAVLDVIYNLSHQLTVDEIAAKIGLVIDTVECILDEFERYGYIWRFDGNYRYLSPRDINALTQLKQSS